MLFRSSKGAPKAGHIIIGVISFAHKKCKTGATGAARSSKKGRNVRTGRAVRSSDVCCLIVACAVAAGIQRRKRNPNQQRSTKSRLANHNRCHLLRTQKVQNRCHRSRPIVEKGAQRAHGPGPSAAPMHHARSYHAQSQLASSSAESAIRISKGAPKAGHQITGVISFAHKKCKAGAIGAARSSQKVRNVRTGRPQPRCIMPDRSMRSRSWHPAQKARSESAKQRSTKSRPPNNRCHLLRTQKVQSRCDRSRPIVPTGAQRAHGPPAAPMHHA